MYIVKYLALVHMAETHSHTRAEYFTIYIQKPVNICRPESFIHVFLFLLISELIYTMLSWIVVY